MLFFPLAIDKDGFDTIQKVQDLLGDANNGIMQSTGALAGGIGSLFLLFVVFYYGTAILEGGKFQVKMLMPVLIFFLASNFDFVTEPVNDLIGGIREGLCGAFQSATASVITAHGGEDDDSIMDIYRKRREEEKRKSPAQRLAEQKMKEQYEDESLSIEEIETPSGTGGQQTEDVQTNMKKSTNIGGLPGILSRSVDKKIGQWSDQTGGTNFSIGVKYTITGFLCSILCWVNNLMIEVLKIFGATMTGIVMAFGPIVWAFAVFPGRGKTIMTWFIRMCQFALYSPIAAFICLLNTNLSLELMDSLNANSGGSLFTLCVSFAASIAALTSVPTIAGMIVEGASGGVSLSSGLQTMAQTVSQVMAIAKSPLSFAKTLRGMHIDKKNKNANESQGKTLKDISETLNQMAQGQNSHK